MRRYLALNIFALAIIMIFLAHHVSAYSESLNYSSSSSIQITQLKYEPYPVNPGEYFDLWIEVNDLGGNPSENIKFELVPEYPFSLDSNEDPLRNMGKGAKSVVLHYKIRVDNNAVEGINELKLEYNVYGITYQHVFDIYVSDAQTGFDLVIQESSGTDISIAIANIGKNTANSLIVRIPEQENYKVSGTNGQMVGNLDSGDYTIVSFTLAQVGRGSDSSSLQVQLDYTDNIGERRSVIKDVSFVSASPVGSNMTGNGQMPSGNFGNGSFPSGNFQQQQSSSIFKSIWFWVVIIIALAGIFYWYYRKNPEKVKSLFSKIKSRLNKKSGSEKISKGTPEWVSAERTKKK